MPAKSKKLGPYMCGGSDVVTSNDRRAQDPRRTPKKDGLFNKAKDWLEGKSPADADRTRPQRTSNVRSYSSHALRQQSGGGTNGFLLPHVSKDPKNQPPSSSHGGHNSSQEADGFQLRAPPPGSYQDDDTGPSPKNLVMAVMGVKSAVNHFAKALISDMTKFPEDLKHLKQAIHDEVQTEVDRANHWKFLVQAFVCKRLFEGFETENGFFGIEYFDGYKMSACNSFLDFSKFKDKAATISGLLATDSADVSYLGKFCFKKFKSISYDLATKHALPVYQEEWSMVTSGRHPKSDFYQSFLKVAVSVWLLHRLVHSFEQGWKMLGWETYPKGFTFQRKNMESVVPGAYEEEDEDTDVNTVVGFLVIPGFQVSKSVVKCEVYLRNKSSHNDGKIEATEMTSTDKSPVSFQIPEKPFSDKSPGSFQTPEKPFSDKSPGSFRTSRSFHTSGSFQTPEKPLSDKSAVSLQTPDSFKSSSNYSGHATRAPPDKEAAYWNSQKQSLGNISGRKLRNVQDRSPNSISGHAESNDRKETSHYYAAPSHSKQSRPAGYVTRHTAISKLREELNRPSV